jgi:hypothetical protein
MKDEKYLNSTKMDQREKPRTGNKKKKKKKNGVMDVCVVLVVRTVAWNVK